MLAGLTVNASGAFGGYLVIFAVTYPFVHQNQNTIGVFMHPYWTVTGEIKLVSEQTGEEVHSELLLGKLNIATKPEIIGNQSFRMRAALPPLAVNVFFGKSQYIKMAGITGNSTHAAYNRIDVQNTICSRLVISPSVSNIGAHLLCELLLQAWKIVL